MTAELKHYSPEELAQRNVGLQEIADVLDGMSVRFMLYDGALLGAVREKNFIPWDWDVELALWAEEFLPSMSQMLQAFEAAGFEIGSVNLDQANLKLNVHKYQTKYSLIGFQEVKNQRRREAYKYPKKFFDNTTRISFLGRDYLCPNPPEEYLTYQYGDWKTPRVSRDPNEYLQSEIFTKSSNKFSLAAIKKTVSNWFSRSARN